MVAASSVRDAFALAGALPASRRAFAATRTADGAACVLKCGGDGADPADPVARELKLLKKIHFTSGAGQMAVALPVVASGTDSLFGASRPYFAVPRADATLADCSPDFVKRYARDIAVRLLDVLEQVHTHHRLLHRDIRPATIALLAGAGEGASASSLVLLGWDLAASLPPAPANATTAPVHFIDLASLPASHRIPTRERLDRTSYWSLRAHRTGGPTCPADDAEAALLSLAAALQPAGWLPWSLDPATHAPYAQTDDSDSPRSPFLTALESRKWQAPVAALPNVPTWLGELLTRVRAMAVGEMPAYAALREVVVQSSTGGKRSSAAAFLDEMGRMRSAGSTDWTAEDD